ncbi:hypothetical protein ACFYSJ_08250 [Streptomyces sp. NPDC005248]|uniref:hypothetical protein n=1 Tax=Streptomyces sp. NPDC005248 TaxID=3364709 RepID=UPI0036795D24
MGRHCEAADALAGDVALAGDIRPGDLRAVPTPPVVAVSDGTTRVLVRRESLDDMSRRDIGL